MHGRILLNDRQLNSFHNPSQRKQQSLQQAQETIYQFLLESVKKDSPESVLLQFKRLFISCENSANSKVVQSLYTLIFKNNEYEFRNTLKRAYYILINNWSSKRYYTHIQELIQLFSQTSVTPRSLSPSLVRLRTWVANFINSEDYQELKLFTSPYASQERRHWSSRYTSYLLVPQYLNSQNPIEQREMAKSLSKRLKEKFKFDLAMYTARCDSPIFKDKKEKISNPTRLGNEVIRLIKRIIARPSLFSYANYANLFIQQTKTLNYKEFKESLHNYLFFSMGRQNCLNTLDKTLDNKLKSLYKAHNREALGNELFLRTCRRIIEFFTTENGRDPSAIFISLITQENPLTVVIILLKVVLICEYVRTHLEVCIAQLIRYYENYSEEQCPWFINFLEIFNIVFTIYTVNVQYNLVKVKNKAPDSQHFAELDGYRVFSQLKGTDLRGANLSGADLRQVDLKAADLRGANLSGADLSQANLSLAKLSRADLSNAILKGANLIAADLSNTDLSGAALSGAKLRRADLRQAKLNSASLTATQLYRGDRQPVDLSSAKLSSTNQHYAELQPADLSDANLKGADLRHAQLLHANLRGANLSQANLSNADLQGANLAQTNLSRANLNHTNLHNADLKGALLRGTMLNHAHLSRANLSYADLSHAQLNNVNLTGTNLSYALLRHVNLNGANLNNANLSEANLFNTNLRCATVKGTQFRENSGLSEETRLDLEQREAIFEIANA